MDTTDVDERDGRIALLESEQAEEGLKRLPDWLRRVRELLAQPAARRWHRFWWR